MSIDEFRIRSRLGEGAMGHVYLAYDVSLDRQVALKFIAAPNPDLAARERLLIEARALARLQHPNVVTIYRVGEVEGRPYLAYEFVVGEPLDRVQRPLPWERVLEIAIGIARGLSAAHDRSILHRDIKPANVILEAGGQPKLIDFGIATMSRDGDPPPESPSVSSAPSERETAPSEVPTPPQDAGYPSTYIAFEESTTANLTVMQRGAFIGTPIYLAPERWEGTPATASADIYAYGLLLYELLTGEHPRLEFTYEQLVSGAIPPLAERLPGVPAPLAHMIDRCLRVDPEERIASARALLESLESLAGVLRVLRRHREDAAGNMSPDEHSVQLVTESFARLSRRRDEFGQRFYAELFTRDPALRLLFPTALTEQQRKLTSALQLAIEQLRNPERLTSLLAELGTRHSAYGIDRSDFTTMGTALLAAIKAIDPDSTTTEVEQAWLTAYGTMARAVCSGLERMSQTVPPLPRYARLGRTSIAYARLGEGQYDLVWVPEWLSHVEGCWRGAELSAWLRRLAGIGRLILFDRRGCGLSDALNEKATMAERVAELRAVLDRAGVERAVLIGEGFGAAIAAHFAVAQPKRTRALVALGAVLPGAHAGSSPLYTLDAAARRRLVLDGWGSPVLLEELAPSQASSSTFRRFFAAYLRMSCPPLAALALLEESLAMTLPERSLLAGLPVLALQRGGDRLADATAARSFFAGIPGARFYELAGEDHLAYSSDTESILEHIRNFLSAL